MIESRDDASQPGAKFWLVVPAAGVGRRFNDGLLAQNKPPTSRPESNIPPKQYQPLLDKTVAQWTLERLLSVDGVAGCVVAISPEDEWWPEFGVTDSRVEVVHGGLERSDTVRLALESLIHRADSNDWVLVHDVARPCVRPADIERLMSELADHPVGGILASPIADTVKRVGDSQAIRGTEDRSQLWSALTPQMFRLGILSEALQHSVVTGLRPTDEAAAVEALGYQPKVVEGQRDNIKITRAEDLVIAEAILRHQEGER